MAVFFKDFKKNQSVLWDDIIDDIKTSLFYNPYCKSDDFAVVFKQIILSLLIGEEIILLDSDFSDSELEELTGNKNYNKFIRSIENYKLPSFNSKEDLIIKLCQPSKKWRITMFTSGTTGLPKKVSHSFNSITRFVKISKNYENNIWGFAYHPTHMAGMQVFFQALLNGNTVVRLFGLNNHEVFAEIKANDITHISATPSFYKLLLPTENKLPSVIRVTSGGEKLNTKIFLQLQNVFPNAKFTNVYASTEAGTLFASENDVFKIRTEVEGLVRVVNNELVIHNDLMGVAGFIDGEWYYTGDLVDVVSSKPLQFRFISRKSEMVNVGGFKVNPHEVEEVILDYDGVKNTRVYSKSNSVLGNIICCEIVLYNTNIKEANLRSYLKTKVQEFKIPRIIKFVDKLSTTNTGKIKRN